MKIGHDLVRDFDEDVADDLALVLGLRRHVQRLAFAFEHARRFDEFGGDGDVAVKPRRIGGRSAFLGRG